MEIKYKIIARGKCALAVNDNNQSYDVCATNRGWLIKNNIPTEYNPAKNDELIEETTNVFCGCYGF